MISFDECGLEKSASAQFHFTHLCLFVCKETNAGALRGSRFERSVNGWDY